VTHDFPAGFCAHWVRVTVDQPCRATATFTFGQARIRAIT